uniref:RecQ mediated genome instability protein 1 OB-fold domain-containing protein n=1 Tax=Sus scrofa TaxID=9823 RepID=A0A8D0Q0M8_PIG
MWKKIKVENDNPKPCLLTSSLMTYSHYLASHLKNSFHVSAFWRILLGHSMRLNSTLEQELQCVLTLFFLCFSLNTPPGTKVKLSGLVDIKNGFLLLNDSNTTVLGGEVEHLIEKWELQR